MKPISHPRAPLPRSRARSRLVDGGVLVLCWLVWHGTVRAQLVAPEARTTRSTSGQFSVLRESAMAASPVAALLETDRSFVKLDPTLLPVSCERVKGALLSELGAPTAWLGKIIVGLYPATSPVDRVAITPEQFPDGWQYYVMLPNPVGRARYVQGLVQVLLLEMANRNTRGHTAEIPMWLSEGLAQQLLFAYTNQIFLPVPEDSSSGIKFAITYVDARRANPLEQAHRLLRAGTPLTFQQLSWPTSEQLAGEAWDLYAGSAQLFVNALLGLRGGAESLRAMIAELPQHYNWQFAFLHAFRAYFQRPLDVEKWWALQVVRFRGLELTETWPLDESWQKLDEILRPRVQIRLDTNDLPMHADVTLQTMLRDWEQPRQAQTLRLKLDELSVLRVRVAPQVVPVLDDYRQTLQIYLQKYGQAGTLPPFRKKADQDHAVEEALKRLDALDAVRGGLRPLEKPAPPNPGPN
jgi:hypothetical protein